MGRRLCSRSHSCNRDDFRRPSRSRGRGERGSRSRSDSRARGYRGRGGGRRERSYSPKGKGGRDRSYSPKGKGGKGGKSGKGGKGGKGYSRDWGKGGYKDSGYRHRHDSSKPDWDCSACGQRNQYWRDECHRCRGRRGEPGDPPPPPREEENPPPPRSSKGQGKDEVPSAPPPGRWDAYYSQGQYGTPPPGASWNNGANAAGIGAPPGAWGDPAMYAQHYQRRDYAQEKPEAYRAFLAHIRHNIEGIEVFLGNNMCQDHHVEDLLACLESFLARSVPRPWRIARLDLARNGLNDNSAARIFERMKVWGLRVKHLDLDYNSVGAKGLAALVDFVWNCPEAILELGLAANAIDVKASDNGEDQVSALLRCLYNHPVYPFKTRAESGVKTVPLVLRLGDNNITDGSTLLKRIRDKGGEAHVRFCQLPDPYTASGEEFLSVFLPFFERQGPLAITVAPAAIEDAQPAAISAGAAGAPVAAPHAAALPAVQDRPAAADEGDEYSESSMSSGSFSPEDEAGVTAQTGVFAQVPVAAEVPGQVHAAGAAPAVGAQNDQACSESEYSSESVEDEVAEGAPQEIAQPQDAEDEDEEEDDGEAQMPDDMLKALDILEAADNAQRVQRPPVIESPSGDEVAAEACSRADSNPGSVSEPSPCAEWGAPAEIDASIEPQALEVNRGGPAEDLPPLPVDRRSRSRDEVPEEPKMLRAAKTKKRAKPPPEMLQVLRQASPPPVSLVGRQRINLPDLKPGHYAKGKAVIVREKFAFVDCGFEVDGLLHLTDLMNEHRSVADLLSYGDTVYVEVHRICQRRKRVSLRQVVERDDASQVDGAVPKLRRRVRKSQKRARKAEKEARRASELGQPALIENGTEPRTKRLKKRRKVLELEGVPAAPDEEISAAAVAADPGSFKAKPKRRPKAGNAGADSDSFGEEVEGTIIRDEEQRHLERDIVGQLDTMKGGPPGGQDKAEFAEFVVEMVKEKKRPSEVQTEVAELVKNDAQFPLRFTDWFVRHVKGQWLRAARGRAGATPKSAARRSS